MTEHAESTPMQEARGDKLFTREDIIAATKDHDAVRLFEVLRGMDRMLTNSETPSSPDARLRDDLQEFLSEFKKYGDASYIFYLGDGGISRLNIDARMDDGSPVVRVNVTSQSSEIVKEKAIGLGFEIG